MVTRVEINSQEIVRTGLEPVYTELNESVNEVQTLTIGGAPDGGTFQLGYGGQVSGNISWNSNNTTLVSNILAALNALSNIESGDVAVAVDEMNSGVGTITITFQGNLAETDVAGMTIEDDSLTGSDPTIAIETTVEGADGDNNHSFSNNGRMFLHVKNESGDPLEVTVETPGQVDALAIADLEIEIPDGDERLIGPFPPNIYNQRDGRVYVNYSAYEGVSVALLRL